MIFSKYIRARFFLASFLPVLFLGLLIVFVMNKILVHEFTSVREELIWKQLQVWQGEWATQSRFPDVTDQRNALKSWFSTEELHASVLNARGEKLGGSKEFSLMRPFDDVPEVLESRSRGRGKTRSEDASQADPILFVLRSHTTSKPEHYVALSLPSESLHALPKSVERVLIWGMFAACLLSVILGAWATRRHVRPIRLLESQLDRAAQNPLAQISWPEDSGFFNIVRKLNQILSYRRTHHDEALLESRKFNAVLNGMSDGLVAVDGDHRIIVMNRTAEELLHLSPGISWAGKWIQDVVRVPAFVDAIRSTRNHNTTTVREETIFTGESERILEIHASPFEYGSETGVALVLRDLTDVRAVERMRKDFVSNASHELRTPLTVLKGYVETLMDGSKLDRKMRERFVEKIHTQVQHLTALTQDLLELSRAEQPKEREDAENFDVVLAFRAMISDYRTLAETKGVQFDARAPESPLMIQGKERDFRQIFMNLADNAIKYTSRGGSVTLELRNAGDWVELKVSDTGIGIPRDDLGRVFERFYRVHAARQLDTEGTGLGLSIVRNLLERLSGEVTLESEFGKGSVFTVKLPLRIS